MHMIFLCVFRHPLRHRSSTLDGGHTSHTRGRQGGVAVTPSSLRCEHYLSHHLDQYSSLPRDLTRVPPIFRSDDYHPRLNQHHQHAGYNPGGIQRQQHQLPPSAAAASSRLAAGDSAFRYNNTASARDPHLKVGVDPSDRQTGDAATDALIQRSVRSGH